MMNEEMVNLVKSYKENNTDVFQMVSSCALSWYGVKRELYSWVRKNGIRSAIQIYDSI